MRQLTRREFLSLSSATAVSLCVLAGTSKAMVPPAAKPPPAGADEELFAQISAQAAVWSSSTICPVCRSVSSTTINWSLPRATASRAGSLAARGCP